MLQIIGVPSYAIFLAGIIIWLHQVSGVRRDTGAIIPPFTSTSNDALNYSFQCSGTGMGVCWA